MHTLAQKERLGGVIVRDFCQACVYFIRLNLYCFDGT